MAGNKKKLGELLLELRLLDKDQLASALSYQRQWGGRLGAALVAKGFISEGTLTRVLSHALSIPMVDLSQVSPEREALRMLNAKFCEANDVVAIALEPAGKGGRRGLVLAMADPLALNVIEEIEFTTGCAVKPVIAPGKSVDQAVRAWLMGERVTINPVSYEKPGVPRPDAALPAEPDEEDTMTLVRAGGQEVVTITTGEVRTVQPPGGGPFGRPGTGSGQPGMSMPPNSMPPSSMPPAAPSTAPSQWQQPANSVAGAGMPRQYDPTEELERKFWALMRVMARKGLITKEEFLREWESFGS